MAGISFDEAFTRLGNVTTKEEFQTLLNSISIDSAGSKTVLYSGMRSDAEKAILSNLLSNPDIRIIDKTDFGRFLATIRIEDITNPCFLI